MKEWPIIFSSPMVNAILEDLKTQTRRVMKRAWDGFEWAKAVLPAKESGWIAWWGIINLVFLPEFTKQGYDRGFLCPYGQVGDRLWVRETWWAPPLPEPLILPYPPVEYAASLESHQVAQRTWRPSIFMPRWASRILLEITEVRVQRIQEISPEDAVAEGAEFMPAANLRKERLSVAQIVFAGYWDSINAKRGYGWGKNPWVWAISFKRIR